MITTEELAETINNLQVKPLHRTILVLIPLVSEVTEGGIIKSETIIAEEAAAAQQFVEVIAVADDVTTIEVGDKVFIQGTITTFAPEVLPPELDVAPDGYTIGSCIDMYVKMKI